MIQDPKKAKQFIIFLIVGFILLVAMMNILAESESTDITSKALDDELTGEKLILEKVESADSLKPNIEIKKEARAEILDMDSVWLNDVIRFSTTQTEVRTNLGEPDSITTPNFECGAYLVGQEPWGDVVNIWHYQGTKIVTFKDKAEIMTVKLRGWDCTLHHSQIIFSGHTTLSDLAKVFPKSVEKSYEWKDVRDGRTYQLVRIAPKPSLDDEWVLKFFSDELMEIEYWTPC